RDGDGYVVNGQKIWSSMADMASWCLLLARTDPTAPKRAGISYFMLDMRSAGVTTRPIRQASGGSEFCEIFLDDVHIPADGLIGEENQGWRIAQTTLSAERGVTLLELAERMREQLNALVALARDRTWGGRPALAHDHLRHLIAATEADVEITRLLALRLV